MHHGSGKLYLRMAAHALPHSPRLLHGRKWLSSSRMQYQATHYLIRKMKKQQTGTADKQPLTIDAATGRLDPTPPVIHLKTADDVRLEIGKVYRDMRQGRIEMADGTKLAYVLGQLNKAIETGIIEARMESIERTLKGRNP